MPCVRLLAMTGLLLPRVKATKVIIIEFEKLSI